MTSVLLCGINVFIARTTVLLTHKLLAILTHKNGLALLRALQCLTSSRASTSWTSPVQTMPGDPTIRIFWEVILRPLKADAHFSFLDFPFTSTRRSALGQMAPPPLVQQPHLPFQALDLAARLVLGLLRLEHQPRVVADLVAEEGERERFEECAAVRLVEGRVGAWLAGCWCRCRWG